MAQRTREELGRKLLYDISTKDLKSAFALVAEGAWLTVEDGNGSTALAIAAETGQAEMVSALLDRGGADINHKDNNGYTPLMHAVQGGTPACVAALISAGADVDATNDDGETALFLAKGGSHFEAASMIADVLDARRRQREEEWNNVATHVDHGVTVSKPLQLKMQPKL